MAAVTPFEQTKELARQLTSILSAVDVDILSREERDLVVGIKQLLEHARLSTRDYDYADTRVEQQKYANETKQYFEQLQAKILKASEFNLFGAVDVAHASARIQQIMANL